MISPASPLAPTHALAAVRPSIVGVTFTDLLQHQDENSTRPGKGEVEPFAAAPLVADAPSVSVDAIGIRPFDVLEASPPAWSSQLAPALGTPPQENHEAAAVALPLIRASGAATFAPEVRRSQPTPAGGLGNAGLLPQTSGLPLRSSRLAASQSPEPGRQGVALSERATVRLNPVVISTDGEGLAVLIHLHEASAEAERRLKQVAMETAHVVGLNISRVALRSGQAWKEAVDGPRPR